MKQTNYNEDDEEQNNDHNKNKTLSIFADDGDSDYYDDDNGDVFAEARKTGGEAVERKMSMQQIQEKQQK